MLLAALALSMQTAPQAPAKRWYKGNLHTHTLNSDGDSTPFEVATWYREHGYQFLILSDHNFLTDVTGLNAVLGAKERYLLIPGEEVTDRYEQSSVHMNAYNLAELIQPQRGRSVADTITNNAAAIRKAGALPSLNHPNYRWSTTIDDMLQVRGLTHFEVYNGHPAVNNHGGGGVPSLEEMWDALLTAGRQMYGVAVDDAHYFKRFGKDLSNPGHGWVWVRSASLSADSITRALAEGDFYSSTGVKLADISISPSEYRITIDRRAWEKTTTYFIGPGGKVLDRSFDEQPVYRFRPADKYVRARVESSGGEVAWTQPAFPNGRPSE